MTRCGLHIVAMYGLFIWNAGVFFVDLGGAL